MKSKFYFLPGVYMPNTASTNRALSYIKAFSELNIDSNVIYFRPNKDYDKIKDNYNNISIKYYWEHFYFKNKYLQYISLIIYYILFLCKLKKGDTVYCYGNAGIWSLILKWRKGVNVYVEYSEHPDVFGIGGKFMTPSLDEFYRLIPKVNGLFVITTSLKEFFQSKGVPSEKIHIANITVDPERFANITKTNNIEPYIAYCGTVVNNKDGLDLLIKSFSYVIKEHSNLKLYIIGPTPNKNDLNVNTQLIKELNLTDSVVFKGVVQYADMPQILKDAQILALCRPDNLQTKNGFATKIGEYLLTENPVVVTSVGDFPIFFKDGKNALLSQPNNPQEFANKIIWALNNPKEAADIGRNGAILSKNEFSYINVVKSICKAMNMLE